MAFRVASLHSFATVVNIPVIVNQVLVSDLNDSNVYMKYCSNC